MLHQVTALPLFPLRLAEVVGLVQRNFWNVDRLRIIHLVLFKVVSDHVRNQQRILRAVNLLNVGVLPLEAGSLFDLRRCVEFDCLEHFAAELGL